jgi:hypothetical protein
MKKTQETLRAKNNTKEHVLHLAFESCQTKWKLVFGNTGETQIVTIDARKEKGKKGSSLLLTLNKGGLQFFACQGP